MKVDKIRKGQIALKLLDEFFCFSFTLDYKILTEKTGIPEHEIREVLEHLEQRLRLDVAIEKALPSQP